MKKVLLNAYKNIYEKYYTYIYFCRKSLSLLSVFVPAALVVVSFKQSRAHAHQILIHAMINTYRLEMIASIELTKNTLGKMEKVNIT